MKMEELLHTMTSYVPAAAAAAAVAAAVSGIAWFHMEPSSVGSIRLEDQESEDTRASGSGRMWYSRCGSDRRGTLPDRSGSVPASGS